MNQLNMIKYLLELSHIHNNVNIYMNYKNAFLSACKHGNVELAKFLIMYSSESLNEMINDSDYDYAFICACLFGHMNVVKYLTTFESFNYNIINGDNSSIAFKNACESGNIDIIDFLIKKTPKKEIDKLIGEQFIYFCKNGNLDAVKYFLELYESNNESLDVNIDNNYAFRHACYGGHLDIVKLLILYSSNKVSCNANIDDIESKTNITIDNYVDAFIVACQNGHMNIVDYLISLDISIYSSVTNCNLFLHLCKRGQIDMLKYLYEEIPTYHKIILINEPYKPTLIRSLEAACKKGYLNIVKYIIQMLPKNDVIDYLITNSIALINAFYSGSFNIIKYLIPFLPMPLSQLLIDYKKRDYNYWLFIAPCTNGHFYLIKYLIKYHLNKNKYYYYYAKNTSWYIVRPLTYSYNGCIMHKIKNFDDFKIYYYDDTYLDNCLSSYEIYRRNFNKKSARK